MFVFVRQQGGSWEEKKRKDRQGEVLDLPGGQGSCAVAAGHPSGTRGPQLPRGTLGQPHTLPLTSGARGGRTCHIRRSRVSRTQAWGRWTWLQKHRSCYHPWLRDSTQHGHTENKIPALSFQRSQRTEQNEMKTKSKGPFRTREKSLTDKEASLN